MKMVGLQTGISCYAVGMAVVKSHTSCMSDEGFCHRIGLCPVKQSELTPTSVGTLQVTALPGKGVLTEVTTDDVQGIPFAQTTPLVTLVEGQRIDMIFHLSKNVPTVHAKWASVAAPVLLAGDEDGQWLIEYENLGQFTDEELKGLLDSMGTPDRLPEDNKYNRVKYPDA